VQGNDDVLQGCILLQKYAPPGLQQKGVVHIPCSLEERPLAAAAAAAVACTSEEGILCSGSFCSDAPAPLGNSPGELLPGSLLGSAAAAQQLVTIKNNNMIPTEI
jgi:hypothetical protein